MFKSSFTVHTVINVIYRQTHAALLRRPVTSPRHPAFLRLDQPSVITLAWWQWRMKADSCDASMDGGTRLNPDRGTSATGQASVA